MDLKTKGIEIRAARPQDAGSICRLYEEAYRPPGAESAREHYPYPQFLDPSWVAKNIESGRYRWFVAQRSGQIIGSYGMVLNVGRPRDRIGEGFGLVIDRRFESQGLGTQLFRALTQDVESKCDFILAQTRTADSRPIKIVRGSGFALTGLEPFTHQTPAGNESMALLVKSRKVQKRSVAEVESEALARLADQEISPAPKKAGVKFEVKRISYEDYSQGFVETLGESQGFVNLDRIEGKNGNRFKRYYFEVTSGTDSLGRCSVLFDRADSRARLRHLSCSSEGARDALLASVHDELRRMNSDCSLFTISLDVLADSSIVSSLQSLGYQKTTYYPGLLQEGEVRSDAFQMYYLQSTQEFPLLKDFMRKLFTAEKTCA